MEFLIRKNIIFEKSRMKTELKVGVFVSIGLILLAVLMLNFSKGVSLFKKTYKIRLLSDNVGGIKEQAAVLMSGVKVGNVVSTTLSTNGSVLIGLEIDNEFRIDHNAKFLIDSQGFLGDQYVAIIVTNNSGTFLTNNQLVLSEPSVNLQETMRSTASLFQQSQSTMKILEEAISNINRTILNDGTLTRFSQSISNLQLISGNANQTLGAIDRLVENNGTVISSSLSNLHDFSADLKTLLATNQNEITAAVKNLASASVTVNELLNDVKATNGLAGALLRDEQLKLQISLLVTNLNNATVNLGNFGSNLNQRGIWSMLWKPKVPKESDR